MVDIHRVNDADPTSGKGRWENMDKFNERVADVFGALDSLQTSKSGSKSQE